MARVLPNVLSLLLHPLWMPVIGTLLILFWSGLYITMLPGGAKRTILLIVGVDMVAMPLAMLVVYRLRHWISSFYIAKRRERILPLALTAIFYYVAYWVLHRLHAPAVIQKFVMASTMAVFSTSIISVLWKISLHGVGIGGVTGVVAALAAVSPVLLPVLLACIVLSGAVGYARIRLDAHTPAEYYAGVLLGFAWMFGIFLI